MQRYFKKSPRAPGFTVLELLVAMAIGLIVLYAMYNIFNVQNKTFSNQEQVVELQQNARAALDMLSREIRIAGYNPTSMTGTNKPGITAATANSISFISDLDGDGDTTADSTNPNENISYDLYTSDGVKCLGRTSNGTKNPVVEHIENLNFTYVLDDGTQTTTPTSTQLDSIRAVQVSLTAQSAKADPNTGSYRTYTLASEVAIRNLPTDDSIVASTSTTSSSSSSSSSTTSTSTTTSTSSTTSTTTRTTTRRR